jgi:hypothetical protein
MERPSSVCSKKNPKVALQSILRTPAEEENTQPLPTNLYIFRDDSSDRLLEDSAEFIAQIHNIETQALSHDLTLQHRAPFPWHFRVPPNHKHTVPMISGCIIPTIMQEALRRTPNHKAAGPNGVPGMILKHMPLGFHETLQLLFQAMSITRITPPLMAPQPRHPHLQEQDPVTLDNYRQITLANALYSFGPHA